MRYNLRVKNMVYIKPILFIFVFLGLVTISIIYIENRKFKSQNQLNNNIVDSKNPDTSDSSNNKPTKATYRKPATQSPKYTDSYEKEITALGKIILSYLKNKDMTSLATYIHDDLGLALSPYYLSPPDQGRILTSAQVKNFFEDTQTYQWGYGDGSGLPILKTNEVYFSQNLYTHDFLNADYVSYNVDISAGNNASLNDLAPSIFEREQVRFIEYYFGGFEEQYEGMDWQALALVFVKLQEKWYLGAILHNEWTI